MEIRSEKELDAAIALARVSKREELLRQARGHTLLRPRRAVIQLGLVAVAAAFILRNLLSGHIAFEEIVPWLILVYVLQLGQRVSAIVELLEMTQSAVTATDRGDGPQAA